MKKIQTMLFQIQKYQQCLKILNYNFMAEGVGFEPTNELPHCWFSRPVLSTAQPPFQLICDMTLLYFSKLNYNFILKF